MKYDKTKAYLYNAIDYMLQTSASEQEICEYLGMSDEEFKSLMDDYRI